MVTLHERGWFRGVLAALLSLGFVACSSSGLGGGGGMGGGTGRGGGTGDPQTGRVIIRGLAYGNGTYVATGTADYGGGAIFRSTDGLAWERVAVLPNAVLQGVAYGNGRFAAFAACCLTGSSPSVV